MIEVKAVSRNFSSVKKEEGLKGNLSLLFKPKKVVHTAVKNVSFTIEEGAFVGLIGHNGAGKTTLLKMLAGLIPPSTGELKVMGFTPFDRKIEFRKTISLVMGQKAQLWWDLPAIDAFHLIQAIYQIPEKVYRERVEQLATLLDVKDHLNTQIRRLSLGERMKMELIGAILHWPKVIYLDEPTIGLDILAASKLREFLKVHNRKEKATIILTSHNMDDIEKLCSRVIIMKEGEMIFDGAPSKLKSQDEKSLRVRLFEKKSKEELSDATKISISQIQMPTEEDDFYRFSLKPETLPDVLSLIVSKFKVIDIGIEEQSLEKVIEKIYQGNPA